MKYFMMINEENNPFPRIVNGNRALDIRKLNRSAYRELPSFLMLDMELGLDAYMPDIIISPFLLLSREAMEIVTLYDEKMPFLFAALFDTRREQCGSYYCPILEDAGCCLSGSGDGEADIVLGREQTGGAALLRVTMKERQRAVIRMDLAESLLARDVTGLELREVVVRG